MRINVDIYIVYFNGSDSIGKSDGSYVIWFGLYKGGVLLPCLFKASNACRCRCRCNCRCRCACRCSCRRDGGVVLIKGMTEESEH